MLSTLTIKAMTLYGEVNEVEQLTPQLVRVVLGGEGLADFTPTEFTDQYVNALFVPDGAPYSVPFDVDAARALDAEVQPKGRRYTIRAWDPETRQVTLDFVVHGDVGFAGRWAGNAGPGDLLQMAGPSGGYAPDPDAAWHLMVGDESAIPAIAASLEQVPAGRRVHAVLVVEDADGRIDLTCPGDLDVAWVQRADGGVGPDPVVAAVAALDFPPGTPQVFVHGEAHEVRAVRKHLFGERGLTKDGTSISPYWRRGDTDEAWRKVKRQWTIDAEGDV